jgi:hypothetical protein
MSVDVNQIESLRDQVLDQMAALLSSAEPTITVNDEEVPWAPLLADLAETVDWCDRKLAEYEPYEVRSRGKT